MGTQKIVNLFNAIDNEFSKFATRKWYGINDVKEMKMMQALSLRQKSLNQIFVIIQTHLFL